MEVPRRSRPRLFQPDERGLGGALQIQADWRCWLRKTYNVELEERKPEVQGSELSERLRKNRAARKSVSDCTERNHLNNLYHLQRRMSNQSSPTEQRKHQVGGRSPGPPTHRASNRSPMVMQHCLWMPQPENGRPESQRRAPQRPSTAPGSLQASTSIASPSGRAGEPVKRARTPKQLPGVEPVQLPLSRYSGPVLLPSVVADIYRSALREEILGRRLYREDDLKALFRQYLRNNPLEHQDSLRAVIQELKLELGVS